MACRRLTLLAVAALLCLSCCYAEEYKQQYSRYKQIPGIRKGEDGQRFLMVGEGESATKYIVLKHEESKMVYFVNEASMTAQWHDPRIEEPSAEAETTEVKAPEEPPKTTSSFAMGIVAMLPLLLFAGGTAARVAYLQIHYPELLWPTKERRDRRKASGGKARPQKQRGKMNQDGKGGRSANS